MPRPYIRLTEAIIAGTADAVAFQLTLSQGSPAHSPAGRGGNSDPPASSERAPGCSG
jgi:hypothetical protein